MLTITEQRNQIISFMEWKSKILSIRLKTNLQLFCQEDKKELENWEAKDIAYVHEKLYSFFNYSYKYLPAFGDYNICPWCLLDELFHLIFGYSINCSNCLYSQRWGKCNKPGKSKYHKLILKTKVNLLNVLFPTQKDFLKAKSFFTFKP